MTVKGKQFTEVNYKHLKVLLAGKVVKPSLSMEAREIVKKETGFGNIDATIEKLEAMGMVSGYAPLLTEKGKKMYDYFRLLYEATGDDSDGLEQLMDTEVR